MAGSPARPTRRRSAPVKSWRVSSDSVTSLPVSIRPQVDTLTNNDSLWPRCFFQLASPSLSRISLSAVPLSGIRSSASATHISSTPSSEDRSYWRMKDSTALWSLARRRTRDTRSAARSITFSRSTGGKVAWASRSLTASVSSRSQAAVMRARAGSIPVGSSGLSMGWVTDLAGTRAGWRTAGLYAWGGAHASVWGVAVPQMAAAHIYMWARELAYAGQRRDVGWTGPCRP